MRDWLNFNLAVDVQSWLHSAASVVSPVRRFVVSPDRNWCDCFRFSGCGCDCCGCAQSFFDCVGLCDRRFDFGGDSFRSLFGFCFCFGDRFVARDSGLPVAAFDI